MIDIRDIQKVYFIGIGGIGMSALARYFKFHGKEVSGYDKTETPLTKQLVSEGIPVHYEDKLELAKALEVKAKEKGVDLLLPTDVVVADNFAADAAAQTVSIENIPDGWMGLDIGPDSVEVFKQALSECRSVIWNGPMGVFEFDKFAVGTEAIAHTLADLTGTGVTTIIGGGDSVAAVEKVGVAEKMSHISTGGGASLELLEGKELPGIAALNDA